MWKILTLKSTLDWRCTNRENQSLSYHPKLAFHRVFILGSCFYLSNLECGGVELVNQFDCFRHYVSYQPVSVSKSVSQHIVPDMKCYVVVRRLRWWSKGQNLDFQLGDRWFERFHRRLNFQFGSPPLAYHPENGTLYCFGNKEHDTK